MNPKWKTAKGKRRAANRRAYLKRKAAASVKGVPNKIKTYVKKVLDRNAEDKHDLLNVFSTANCQQGGFNSTLTNIGLTSTSSIIPVVSQGTGVDQRIGNRISVKSLTGRLILQARPVNPTDNYVSGLPFYVRVVFYNRKDSMTNYTNDTILDLGGSSTSFTGSLASLLLKYNKDTFNIIKSYTFKMAPAQSINASAISSAENMPNGFMSHVMKNIKIPCVKKLVYDDASIQPNHRIYCAIGVVNSDSSAVLPAGTGYRLRVSLDTHIVYEDD